MKSTLEKKEAANGDVLVLRNQNSDPGMWIVDVMKKSIFGKKKSGSYWFSSRQDAEEYIRNYKGK